MQRKGNAYYYVCKAKWLPLGSDLARAKRRWAELEGDGYAPSSVSVADLVQRYIDREDRPAGTLMQYRSWQRALAKAFPISAAALTSQHVALWRETQWQHKAYCNGAIALLGAAMKLGKELGLAEPLTVSKWPLEGRQRRLEEGEFLAIRSRAPAWLQIAMDLGYRTAPRPVDILALRWDQVAPDRILLRAKKTGKWQAFRMTPELDEILTAARSRPIVGLFVVASDKGRPISYDQLNDAWRAACAASGVEDAQFRDIRAMSATAADEDGQDAQALLGHSSRQTTERYIRGRRTIVSEPVRRKLK